MRLLLHICCGPCLIYPFKILKENNFDITGFFYNPNIYPENEYNLRLNSVKVYSEKVGLEIIKKDFDSVDFFNYIGHNEEKTKRCKLCYRLRLHKTAEIAKELNFEYFTTTLLVSPYQDHNELKTIAEDIALKVAIKFFYYDFRQGFVSSRIVAKENNLYLQKYCGCNYSREERKVHAVSRV